MTGSALGARRSAETTARARLEISAGIARITLERPPLNVVDIEMLDELLVVIGAIARDDGVRCVLVQGAGKAFCAGVDVADHTAERVERMLTSFNAVISAIQALPMPVVGAVQGAALGGGMELAIACDVVIAREDATFGQPEIRLGVFPPAAAAMLPGLIGRQRAMDLMLSGRSVKAAEALALGLVSAVHTADKFAGGVEEYVTRLASYSGPVLRLAKRAATEGMRLNGAQALANAEELYLSDLMALEDPQEGIAAWVSKRTPTWRNA